MRIVQPPLQTLRQGCLQRANCGLCINKAVEIKARRTTAFEKAQSSRPRFCLRCNPRPSIANGRCQIHQQRKGLSINLTGLHTRLPGGRWCGFINSVFMIDGFTFAQCAVCYGLHAQFLTSNRQHVAGFNCERTWRQGETAAGPLHPGFRQGHIGAALRQGL